MKFLRFGEPGREKPGVLDESGNLRDLSSLTRDINGDFLGSAEFSSLGPCEVEALPKVSGTPRLGPPVAGVSKLIGFGVNYHSMVAERGMETPRIPILFFKSTGTIVGPNDPVVLPEGLTETVWEVEIALVIGRTVRNLAEDEACGAVAGYMTANDLTETSFQRDPSGQWWLGKNFDTFTPLGPWLVRASDIPSPDDLELVFELDGKEYQREKASGMIFKVPELVSFASRHMTLFPGDIILTGSPAGVGANFSPQVFLKPSSRMTATVDGLGTQTSPVI